MSDPLLPSGIHVGSGADLNERPVVRVDIAVAGAADPMPLVFVGSPAQARTMGLFCLDQEDRRVRALGALLIRQADLVEGRHLRLVRLAWERE